MSRKSHIETKHRSRLTRHFRFQPPLPGLSPWRSRSHPTKGWIWGVISTLEAMGVSINGGAPIAGWYYKGTYHWNLDDLGVPHGSTISGNLHMYTIPSVFLNIAIGTSWPMIYLPWFCEIKYCVFPCLYFNLPECKHPHFQGNSCRHFTHRMTGGARHPRISRSKWMFIPTVCS